MGFKNFMLSALLLTSASVHADTIGWGNQPTQPGQPNRPSQPNFPSRPSEPSLPGNFDPWEHGEYGSGYGNGNNGGEQRFAIEENIQNYFEGQSRLDLLSDQYIRFQLQGLRIRDITIIASTERGHGVASLVLNGQSIESSKVVARQMASYTFRVDPFTNTAGISLRAIELSMQGRFYVEKVIFNLFENSGPNRPGPTRPPGGTQVEVVKQQLNDRIRHEGGLDFFRIFNLELGRQGQEIKRVTILARSDRGFGLASLMVNNQQFGPTQNISYNSTRFTFELSPGMRIGQSIQGLRLYLKGDIFIEEVSVEIEKRGGNDGRLPPTEEQRFEQVLNQRLYATSGIYLRDLIQIPSRFDEKLVDSVVLYLRNSEVGVNLKICQVIQDRYQSVNCGGSTTISSGEQEVRLSSVSFAKLSEIQLSTRMGMIDIARVAINFR